MENDHGQTSSFVVPQRNAPRTMAKVQKAEGADGDHCINSSGINIIAFMARDTTERIESNTGLRHRATLA